MEFAKEPAVKHVIEIGAAPARLSPADCSAAPAPK